MLDTINEYIIDLNNLYGLDNKTIFIYIVIFFLIFVFISSKNITIASILGIIIGYYIYNNLINATKNRKDKIENLKKEKIKYIRPYPEKLEKYDDIIDFLYSIQDLYIENPASYQEMIESIQAFFIVYEESMILPELSHRNYSVLELKLNESVNLLQSIIINSRNNRNLEDKINRAYVILYGLLYKYLDEIELNIKKDIKLNGYNLNTRASIDIIKPSNYSESQKYMFDFIYN